MTRQGEEAIGRLAQELLDNPMVSGALSRAFETRERAMRAQEVAMGALNLPSASDLERLTRRIRSVSQRLEGIEDGLDRLKQKLQGLGGGPVVVQEVHTDELDASRREVDRHSTEKWLLVPARSAPRGPEDQDGLPGAEIDGERIALDGLACQFRRSNPHFSARRSRRHIGLKRAAGQHDRAYEE